MLQEEFEKAVADSRLLAKKPDNNTLLKLYSLYKQGTQGDADDDGPTNAFDFVGKAKYDAWDALRGKTKDAAMQEYITLVESLKAAK